MAHTSMGFSSSPKNLDKTWKCTIDETTYIFTKKRHNETTFLYSCERSMPSGEKGPYAGFYSDRDLQSDEIEKLRQFENVIARAK